MAFYFDFSAILALGSLITGAIWLADSLFFKPKRKVNCTLEREEAKKTHYGESKLVEYSRSFFPILFIVLLLRSFVAEPFRIPSGSMKPSLLEGDFILVKKYTYGFRLPVIGLKVIPLSDPKPGDVLIFRFPKDTSVNFIKRVIAVPGDTVSYKDHTLFINGQKIQTTYLDSTQDTDGFGRIGPVKRYEEDLNGVSHFIYNAPFTRLTQSEIKIPAGHYFVMGDNRDNSEDSRVWGLVPDNLILGKGAYVWFSWDSEHKDVRWSRMFKRIQ